ncbi:MAG: alpha/beta fold hydrolase [Emcibacter sp.]|nr:alpha/beta fold hydrolase [Emcibacter sp.]
MSIHEASCRLRRMTLGDVKIAYKDEGNHGGSKAPIICIHGSWDDHHSWDGVAENLSADFRVITYDRRGHSASTTVAGQGHLCEDVADVLAFMEGLNIASAHIVGHSYGANVAIALAGGYPGVVRSLFVHEPPLFSLLNGTETLEALRNTAVEYMKDVADLIEKGAIEEAARIFIEKVAFGEGSWLNLFDERARTVILSNVDSWLDQFRDPERLAVDVVALEDYPHKFTLSTGTNTLTTYSEVVRLIVEMLPMVQVVKIEGGGHGGHISHPQIMSEAIRMHVSN